MNRDNLDKFTYLELKNIATDLHLNVRKSKDDMIGDILKAFREYEKYKKDKIDKYTKGKQLGENGKEGITYSVICSTDGKEYAMKTFRRNKSSALLRKEAELQKKAADVGVAPNIIDIDTVSKFIIMEKMEKHLLSVMKAQNGEMTRQQQKQIITIYKKLDEAGVFYGDNNLMNYMFKGKKLYIIDFGIAKDITSALVSRLGTTTPNITIMTLGLILKLRDMGCSSKSYEYLSKYLSEDHRQQYNINNI